MLARQKAFEVLTGFLGKHEEGGNNRGAFVGMVQRADGLTGEGYAWCQALQNACWRLATGGTIKRIGGRDEIVGGKMLAGGTASVGQFVAYARTRGWVVDRPLKWDHVAYLFDTDAWADHVGQIEKVLKLGPVLVIRTIEGNTSADSGGSQADGDGVYRKTRTVRASRVVFIRVPGLAVEPPKLEKPRYHVTVEKPIGTLAASFETDSPGKRVHELGVVAHRYDRVVIQRIPSG